MTVKARPIRARRWAPAAHAVAVLTAVAVAAAPLPVSVPQAHAQAASTIPRGIPLIRDAEIEQLLREYTQPILRVAGLAQQQVQVVIIQDRSFNAFVMDGRHIFVNAGALMDSKTPNEIIGVLAHETGHMAGGHLSKMRQQMATLQTASSPCSTAWMATRTMRTVATLSPRWPRRRTMRGAKSSTCAAVIRTAKLRRPRPPCRRWRPS